MFWWLLKNYFKLNSFMYITFHPFKQEYSWKVSYKIKHNKLNDYQKKLSNEFINRLENLEFN